MEAIDDTFDISRGAIASRPFSQAFWDGSREKKLLLQRCVRTGQYQFFPRPVSIATGRKDIEWCEVDGRGEVYSFSIARRGPGQFQQAVPYALIIARLDVGVDIMANIVRCPAEELAIGMRVKPFWMPLPDGRHLLQFQPD